MSVGVGVVVWGFGSDLEQNALCLAGLLPRIGVNPFHCYGQYELVLASRVPPVVDL